MKKLILTFLVASICTGLSAQENFELEIHGEQYGVQLNKKKTIKDVRGKEAEVIVRQKNVQMYDDAKLSFSYDKDHAYLSETQEDGTVTHIVLSSSKSALMFIHNMNMEPLDNLDSFLPMILQDQFCDPELIKDELADLTTADGKVLTGRKIEVKDKDKSTHMHLHYHNLSKGVIIAIGFYHEEKMEQSEDIMRVMKSLKIK